MGVYNTLIIKHQQVNNGTDDVFYEALPVSNMIVTGVYVSTSGSGLMYTLSNCDDGVGTNSFTILRNENALAKIENPDMSFDVVNPQSFIFNKPFLKITTNSATADWTYIYICYKTFNSESPLIANNLFQTKYQPPTGAASATIVLSGPVSGAYLIKNIFVTNLDSNSKSANLYVRNASLLSIPSYMYSSASIGEKTIEMVGNNIFYLMPDQDLILKTDADPTFNTIITYTKVD
jgi:hypothetical protein